MRDKELFVVYIICDLLLVTLEWVQNSLVSLVHESLEMSQPSLVRS